MEKSYTGHMATDSLHDAVVDGQLICGLPSRMVFVSSEEDLEQLSGYPVGTIAAQYAFKNLWHLTPDGWEAIFAEAETAAASSLQEAS